MDEPLSFGYWVRRRRKALDLTQDELARRADCSLGAIRKLESDERRPSREIAERLAEVLKVPAEERAAFLQVARTELSVGRLPAVQLPGMPDLPRPLPPVPAPPPVLPRDLVPRPQSFDRLS